MGIKVETFPPGIPAIYGKTVNMKHATWQNMVAKETIEVDGKGFDALYEVLLEQFPSLSNAGGIELMRTGCTNFHIKPKSTCIDF